LSGIDYEVEYNNRARVPEHPAVMAGWVRDASAYRESHPPRSIPYGAGGRNVIDFFEGDGNIVKTDDGFARSRSRLCFLFQYAAKGGHAIYL